MYITTEFEIVNPARHRERISVHIVVLWPTLRYRDEDIRAGCLAVLNDKLRETVVSKLALHWEVWDGPSRQFDFALFPT